MLRLCCWVIDGKKWGFVNHFFCLFHIHQVADDAVRHENALPGEAEAVAFLAKKAGLQVGSGVLPAIAL